MTLTMLPLTVLSLLVSGLASASPLLPRQMATSNSTLNSTTSATINATVTLPNSSVSVVGTYYPPFAQDVYLGIPFAQPPVGALRFSAPIAPIYNSSNTTIITQQQTPACSQIPTGSLASTFGVSEDCLTLNVYAPHGLNSTANLPVMVWIYGGGFIEGTSASFNATALVGQSIIETQPIIFVAVQYRVGIWGFAQGIQAATNNATNLGLRDQVLALEWVQSNIAAFGGDPTKVVVAGESAGAISIALHYLNPSLVGSNGSNTTMNSTMSNMTVSADSTMSMATSLFRGAIMESGAMSTYPLNNASISRQTPFDQIANLTGCTANATANATMGNMTIGGAAYNQSIWNCLKYVNNMTLLNATIQVLQMPENQYGNFIFGPSIDYDIVPASPAQLISEGKFARYPFISGNNEDEGTIFYPPLDNTTAEFTSYIDSVLPSTPNASVLQTLLSFYPDAASGSPFGTGNETFGLSPFYKIGAAIFSDTSFQAPRRDFLRRATQYGLNQTWSYQFEQNLNTSSPAGVYHGSEVPFVFGAYSQGNATSPLTLLSQQMVAYWLNFVSFLDPNGNSTASPLIAAKLNLTTWPTYSSSTPGGNLNMLRLEGNNLTVFQDTYRREAMFYINSIPEALDH